ncbi:hypothetical protein M446_5964 [Methylobacterium sp. 4-46]|uniref:hypothetical protein n=1 Tax=unclassified Methylobacterium TaxID=2615210 RepID=UPI000152E716|nr:MULTISPECIES: hypothetical protein [Methylobacterium]ACA20244.1 hypothetical protein M446_5964 [Methylobacterium sp. 4-46]WFT79420.1 hypothetical protein QA634_30105 [Methylobacterium nodulans]
MDATRLRARLDAVRRRDRARVRARLDAAGRAILAGLPPGLAGSPAPTPAGLALTVAGPGLAAREFGTAARPARPVLGPLIDCLRADPPPGKPPDPEP